MVKSIFYNTKYINSTFINIILTSFINGNTIPNYLLYICNNQFKKMSKITKIVLLVAVLNGIMLTTKADRGIGKNKKKVSLNISTAHTSFTKVLSLNLKSGLRYKGTLLTNVESTKNSVFYNTLVTYQKGNTIYIIPYKQKMIVPEIKQGYTGMKLIIKPNL
jgi:hypothetical protein